MKIICVCKHCGEHDSEMPAIEINFRDNKIYYYCRKCKENGKQGLNEIFLIPPDARNAPLPRIRPMGR